MKRSVTDVLRRGILSTLANWPVILTRVIETLVLFGAVVVAIVGIVVPLLVSAGMKQWTIPAGQTPQEVIAAILVEHAPLWTYLFLFVLAIGLVMAAIHAFVTAGATRIYVDGERAAPDAPELRREQFEAFTLERWSAGARAAWLRIFWIYNGAWGMFGLILLLPVLIVGVLVMMAALADNLPATLAATCGGSVLLLVVSIPLAIVIGMWAQKAVVVCVTRDASAGEALRSGWRETRADFLRHFVVYFLIAVISAGASALLSSAFAPFSFGVRSNDIVALLTGPVRIASFAAQSAVGSAVGSWLIAAFAAMTEER